MLLESSRLYKAGRGAIALWIWKEFLLCYNSRIWSTSEKEVKMTRFFHISCHRQVSAFSITSDDLHLQNRTLNSPGIPLFVAGTFRTGTRASESGKASLVVSNKPNTVGEGRRQEKVRAASSRMMRFPALGAPLPSLTVTHALWSEADSGCSQPGSRASHNGKVAMCCCRLI